MCRFDPKVGLVFKKLFGSEENKDLLKSLINSLLPESQQAVEIHLKNPYNLADYIDGKLSILDIKAVDEKGKWYDIEMQVEGQGYYGQRAMYYWGKVYTDQMETGGMFSQLKKTIVISILDFVYFPDDERYHRIIAPMDIETGRRYDNLDYMDLHFVELKKFHKGLKEIKTTLDRWVTFLNNAYKYEKNNIPEELLRDKEVKKAIEKLDVMYLDEKEREHYEAARKAMWNRAEELRTAEEKGLKKGHEKGLNKGKKEVSMEIAKTLKETGVEGEIISKSTGLSKEEIEAL